jgi:hypothetical protein
MACIAPSLVLTPQAAGQLGLVAEAIIARKYLSDVGRLAYFPAPPGMDFLDITAGFGNTSLYAAFLVAKHPRLTAGQIVDLSNNGLVKIPDLVTSAPPSTTEFYEIKPNSPSGLAAGSTKIANVHALYQSKGLPYTPGTKWKPDTRVNLFSGSLLGLEVEVNFHFFRVQPGLIAYEVCAEGRTKPLTNAEIAAIVAIVLLALLAAALMGGIGAGLLVFA